MTDFTTEQLTVNGIDIQIKIGGAGKPLTLLHGFTGSSRDWDAAAPALAGDYRVLCVDLIGHGGTAAPLDPERYSMERCLDDLLALFDRLAIDRTALAGYSMGGRTALQLAVNAPDRISALVLESASPGLDDPAERDARRRFDRRLAAGIESDGLPAFIDYWESLPLFASQRRLPAADQEAIRTQRLANPPHGLANSLRGMGTGSQSSLWELLPGLKVPCLVIAGAEDEKYRAVAYRMAEVLPEARIAVVRSAGHNVHREQPALFLQEVQSFLGQTIRSEC